MQRYFRRVEARALELGNHRRKYLHGIDRYGRLLIDRLEESGSFDRVHLRRRAVDVAYEMDCVLHAGRGEKEKLALLGCYYALQFLLVNIRTIDMLRLNVSEEDGRIAVYRDFLRRTGNDYSRLVREYVRRLLRIFTARAPRCDYMICAVGTRIHQDDIDLGIIDDGSPERAYLNAALGKMATELMRWSSGPDFYLSEHVGAAGYTVSIDEYVSRLDKRILDFVSVTEILAASPLVGSRKLFERFQSEIHERFYFGDGENRLEHEGYVRGLIGEIQSLLWWPQNPNIINPKLDLLRLVTALLWSLRVTRGIQELGTWKTIDALSKDLKRQRDTLRRLETSYTFVETFRHLYQQFAAQEEEIDVSNPVERANLQQVAEAMGYQDTGVIEAWQHMLVHYHEYVASGRRMVEKLVPLVTRHIRQNSVFVDIVRASLRGGSQRENLAQAILKRHAYFDGIKYWHDLMDVLSEPRSALRAALVRDLGMLSDEERNEAIEGFADWGRQTYYTALRLLTVLGDDKPGTPSRKVFEELNAAFMRRVLGEPDEIRRFATVFVRDPEKVHDWLGLLGHEDRERFTQLMRGKVWGEELGAWQERLSALAQVHSLSSVYFKRALERVCDEMPEYLLYLNELGRLDKIAKGQLAEAIRAPAVPLQKASLGTFYDVEFLRAGLATLRGARVSEVNTHFSQVCDQYVETLFDICKAELDRERGRRILTHDNLGLFVAGGHARERAFQDDWDLFVLLFSDSEEVFEYTNRILARFNREITRRGLMPQYHFADRFGAFVTRIGELESFLGEPEDDDFVEMAQLLGARMVVGSSRAWDSYIERILEGGVFSRGDHFMKRAAEEIRSRHAWRDANGGWENDKDIKECRGGLRDLELLMLIWKVHDRARDSIGDSFWERLAERHPEQRDAFTTLREASDFLNRLRDVYRLTIAPVNRLHEGELDRAAQVMGYSSRPGRSGAGRLWDEFLAHRGRVAEHVDRMLEHFKL